MIGPSHLLRKLQAQLGISDDMAAAGRPADAYQSLRVVAEQVLRGQSLPEQAYLERIAEGVELIAARLGRQP